MSEQDTLPTGVHPEVALLPWYANRTLGEQERQQIAHHLETCASCRAELEELSHLETSLIAAYRSQPEPSARLAQSVMAKVAAERLAGRNKQSESSSWLTDIDRWFRSLFLPQWVPTLAVLLLVAQMGLLLWVGLPPVDRGEVSTRSLSMQTAKFAVTFQASSTEEQIRSLLQNVHGRVIDGPTAEGLYTIEVPSADGSTTQKKLDVLKERSDIVRSADILKP